YLVLVESGVVTQRRRSMEPVERGRWPVSCYAFPGLWFENRSTHILLRGNGRDAWFGWPTVPRPQPLRGARTEAPHLDVQRRVPRQMHICAMDELPAIPLGAICRMTAFSRSLKDRVIGMPIFWNIRRA